MNDDNVMSGDALKSETVRSNFMEKTYQTRWMWRLGIMLPFWPPDWLHRILEFPDRFITWPPARVEELERDDD
jgi:hypothetical protein